MGNRPENISKFVYWTPRVLSILFICFLALFSLDVFGMGLSLWQTILAFLAHNIPVFILAIVLWISWRREIVGGVAFLLAGLIYCAFMINNALTSKMEWYMLSYSLIIAGPAFFIGYLFLVNWKKKKKNTTISNSQ